MTSAVLAGGKRRDQADRLGRPIRSPDAGCAKPGAGDRHRCEQRQAERPQKRRGTAGHGVASFVSCFACGSILSAWHMRVCML